MPQFLVDSYGRRIRKLRVSLTDQCNLRCHYCMPLDAQFLDKKTYLKPEEYREIIAELIDFGLEEVRLTGGEPLLRANFADIVPQLAHLPLQKIGLTTNGILLDRYIDVLLENNVLNLNISLDSLSSATFEAISHGKYLERVLDNIKLAKKSGLRIKINTVMMRGINAEEVLDFVEYSKAMDVEVRFLEIMRIGYACHHQEDTFISARELLDVITAKYNLQPVNSALDATAFSFVSECGARIGFIASESQPFCGHCSRWRLSVDGVLRACLLKNAGISIRNLSREQRQEIYQQSLGMKPYLRPPEVNHPMHQIGG